MSKMERRIETDLQRSNLIRFIEKMDLGEDGMLVTVQPFQETRSARQNRLLWAHAYGAIAEQLSEANNRLVTKEHIHEMLSSKFLPRETNPLTGKTYPVSTTSLNKKQFSDYLEQVYAWGADHGVWFD